MVSAHRIRLAVTEALSRPAARVNRPADCQGGPNDLEGEARGTEPAGSLPSGPTIFHISHYEEPDGPENAA